MNTTSVQIEQKAEVFSPSTGEADSMTWVLSPGNRLEALHGIGAGNTASASTINGGYALSREKALRGTSRSRIITEDDAMSIKREDLDAGRIDFADVITGKRLPLIHPGEILRDDFLADENQRLHTRAGHQGATLTGQGHRAGPARHYR